MEAKEATPLKAERAEARQADWLRRVNALYVSIEEAFASTSIKADRTGKHETFEELARRAGLTPLILDILRLERCDGTNAAILMPRGLWVIGANGRVDLRIIDPSGSSETYLLLDLSEPLSGQSNWVRSRISNPFVREQFDVKWLRAMLLDH